SSTVQNSSSMHFPGVGKLKASRDAHQRRLSSSVRPDERSNPSRLKNSVKSTQNFLRAIGFEDRFQLQRWNRIDRQERFPPKSALANHRNDITSASAPARLLPTESTIGIRHSSRVSGAARIMISRVAGDG